MILEDETDNLSENLLSSFLLFVIIVIVAEGIERWGLDNGRDGSQRWGLEDLHKLDRVTVDGGLKIEVRLTEAMSSSSSS